METEKRRKSTSSVSPGPTKRSNSNQDYRSTINDIMGRRGAASAKDVSKHKAKKNASLSERYSKAQEHFHRNGLTQQFYFFLKAISWDTTIPYNITSTPLLRNLQETAKELLLNELELVVWAIYLEKHVWQYATEENLSRTLLFSAFAAKTYMNDEIQPFQQHIVTTKIPNFNSIYNEWLNKYRQKMGIPPKLLNEKYIQLKKSLQLDENSTIIDYNYVVDEIIEQKMQQTSTSAWNSENYKDFVKLIEKLQQKEIINAKKEYSSYEVQDIAKSTEIPTMDPQDVSILNGVLVRADSVLDNTAPPQETDKQPQPQPTTSQITSDTKDSLLLSKPTLQKLGSFFAELDQCNDSFNSFNEYIGNSSQHIEMKAEIQNMEIQDQWQTSNETKPPDKLLDK